MEEERAEQGVYEKLLFEAQMKEIDERREYARKLFLEEENIKKTTDSADPKEA